MDRFFMTGLEAFYYPEAILGQIALGSIFFMFLALFAFLILGKI